MAILESGKFYKPLSKNYEYMEPNHVLYACAYKEAQKINPQKFSKNIYPSNYNTLIQEIYENNIHRSLKSIKLSNPYLTSVPSDLTKFTDLEFVDLRDTRIEPEVIVSYFHDKEMTVIIDSLIARTTSQLLEEKESLVGYKKCKLVFNYSVDNTLYIPKIKNGELQYKEKVCNGNTFYLATGKNADLTNKMAIINDTFRIVNAKYDETMHKDNETTIYARIENISEILKK